MFCVWMRSVGEESEGSGQVARYCAHRSFAARRAKHEPGSSGLSGWSGLSG